MLTSLIESDSYGMNDLVARVFTNLQQALAAKNTRHVLAISIEWRVFNALRAPSGPSECT